MTRTVEQIIEDVNTRVSTQYEGKPKRDIEVLVEEVERLRAIVDRLPKTADGVRVFHGDKIWYPGDLGSDYHTVTFNAWGEGGAVAIRYGYSSYEAAQRAVQEASGEKDVGGDVS